MLNLKIFIRTTGERELDESINRELGENYTLLVDTEHKPVDSFINQLKIISKENALLLEDDVILCKNFLDEISKAITQYGDFVINFFSFPFQYLTTVVWQQTFVYNQCTYYPKGLAEQIANKMIELRKPYSQYDVLENLALRDLELLHVIYRPCLVQHIDNNTLIQSNHGYRRCIWFKDYLDELNIPYEKAWTKENKEKLTQLMREKFKG